MFARRERFPRARFPEALRRGKRFSSPHFVALVPPSGRGCAVVIPKKVLRLAVRRHTLKRRILAALRNHPLPQALIIFPRAEAYTLPYQELQAELTHLITQLT